MALKNKGLSSLALVIALLQLPFRHLDRKFKPELLQEVGSSGLQRKKQRCILVSVGIHVRHVQTQALLK